MFGQGINQAWTNTSASWFMLLALLMSSLIRYFIDNYLTEHHFKNDRIVLLSPHFGFAASSRCCLRIQVIFCMFPFEAVALLSYPHDYSIKAHAHASPFATPFKMLSASQKWTGPTIMQKSFTMSSCSAWASLLYFESSTAWCCWGGGLCDWKEHGEFSLLIRIPLLLPTEAAMRGTDERRGYVGPEIDQNLTGLRSSGGHRRGRNVSLRKPGHAKWSCLTGLQIQRCSEES